MFYIVYKTTHLETGKHYYGMHATAKVDDGYLGSGTWIKRAVKKYGVEAFKREIIQFCSSYEEMQNVERAVIAQHLNEELCLNIAFGGKGGWGSLNADEFANERRSKGGRKAGLNKNSQANLVPLDSNRAKKQAARLKEKYGDDYYVKLGARSVTDEKRRKLSEASAGKKLMNDGSIAKWVEPTNVQTLLDDGWVLGRK